MQGGGLVGHRSWLVWQGSGLIMVGGGLVGCRGWVVVLRFICRGVMVGLRGRFVDTWSMFGRFGSWLVDTRSMFGRLGSRLIDARGMFGRFRSMMFRLGRLLAVVQSQAPGSACALRDRSSRPRKCSIGPASSWLPVCVYSGTLTPHHNIGLPIISACSAEGTRTTNTNPLTTNTNPSQNSKGHAMKTLCWTHMLSLIIFNQLPTL
mgnify:CR=1 FL=1